MAATQAANESPSTSFGRVVQIEAGVLEVGYVDAGPADGPAVVLLHGWPYDIHSYAEVTPRLAVAGYRMIVPYLRGYGTTRFLSETKVRNGEQAALAFDTIALMDALGIETAIIAGFDWGARSADIVAALWPERVSGLVSVSGYLIGSQHAGKVPLPPQAEHQSWYQYYFATERGRAGYDQASRGPTAIPVLTPPPRRLTPAATTAKRVRAARCDRRPADARHVARDVCLIPAAIASARRSRCDRRPAHRSPQVCCP